MLLLIFQLDNGYYSFGAKKKTVISLILYFIYKGRHSSVPLGKVHNRTSLFPVASCLHFLCTESVVTQGLD